MQESEQDQETLLSLRSHTPMTKPLTLLPQPPACPALLRSLTAAKCHNRAHWFVFVVVQISIAFIFKAVLQFLSDLREQLILNVHFSIKWCATSLHLKMLGGHFS